MQTNLMLLGVLFLGGCDNKGDDGGCDASADADSLLLPLINRKVVGRCSGLGHRSARTTPVHRCR